MEPLTALFYDYVPDMAERRGPYREEHLDLLRALHDTGDVRIAGAVGDPPSGGLLIFTSPEAAQDFVDADPYGSAGLVLAHRIEPWTVVVG